MFVVLPSLLLYDTKQVTNLKLLGHLANERWEKLEKLGEYNSKGCEENTYKKK